MFLYFLNVVIVILDDSILHIRYCIDSVHVVFVGLTQQNRKQ